MSIVNVDDIYIYSKYFSPNNADNNYLIYDYLVEKKAEGKYVTGFHILV